MKPLLLLSGCLALGVAGAAFAFGPSLPFGQGSTYPEAHSSPKAVAIAHNAFVPDTPTPEAERAARKAKAEREADSAILLKAIEVREAARVRHEAIMNATADSVADKRLPSYKVFNVDEPWVALTFDDGPSPNTTPQLLDMLKERGVRATFFVLGQRAAQHPELLRRIVEEGHELANHSWNHPQLPKLSLEAAEKQITDTDQAIFDATGQKTVYMRPPYGAMKASLQDHLNKKFGISFIYWTIDPMDWKFRDPKVVHERIMSQVSPGAIVLAHDIHASTVAAMPQVLDDLIAKGYRFGTLSQMVAMDRTGKPRVAATHATPAANRAAPRAAAVAPARPATQAARAAAPASDPTATGTIRPRTVTTTSIAPRPYAANRADERGLY